MTATWTIPADVYDPMVAQAEKDYPEETCGLLFGTDGALAVVPMENIQNKLHAKDPETYSRDAKTAYQFDGMEFERVCRENEKASRALRSIYHSHPDHEAYFSKKDREDAAPAGWGPLYPEATYIVFSIREGKAVDVMGYRWSDDEDDFVEVKISRGEHS